MMNEQPWTRTWNRPNEPPAVWAQALVHYVDGYLGHVVVGGVRELKTRQDKQSPTRPWPLPNTSQLLKERDAGLVGIHQLLAH